MKVFLKVFLLSMFANTVFASGFTLETGVYVNEQNPTKKQLEGRNFCAIEVRVGAQRPENPGQPGCEPLDFYFVEDPRYPNACRIAVFGPYPVCTETTSTRSFIDLRCPYGDYNLCKRFRWYSEL